MLEASSPCPTSHHGVSADDARREKASARLWYVIAHAIVANGSSRGRHLLDHIVLTNVDDISEGRYKVAEKTITNHLKKAPNSSTAQVARLVLQLAQNAPAETWQKTLGVIRRVSGLSPSNLWRTERALKEIGRCKPWSRYAGRATIGGIYS